MAALDRLGGLAAETTLAIKAPCNFATTAAITLSGVQTIDGNVVGNNSERILVKNQADTTTNGIYVASSGNWELAVDASGNTDWANGTFVYIAAGTANIGQMYKLVCTDNPIIVGTSHLVFSLLGFHAEADVRNFGAVPGAGGGAAPTVDSTTAFQAAINSFGTTSGIGGVINVTGTYLVGNLTYPSSPPTPTANVPIVWRVNGAIYLAAGATWTQPPYVAFDGLGGSFLDQFSSDSQAAVIVGSTTSDPVVKLIGASQKSLKNVRVTGIGGGPVGKGIYIIPDANIGALAYLESVSCRAQISNANSIAFVSDSVFWVDIIDCTLMGDTGAHQYPVQFLQSIPATGVSYTGLITCRNVRLNAGGVWINAALHANTNGATAGGGTTLNFANVSDFVGGSNIQSLVGKGVTDNTTSVIPAGTTVLSVTATTVVISAAVTGGGVLNGDQIVIGSNNAAATHSFNFWNPQTENMVGGRSMFNLDSSGSGAVISDIQIDSPHSFDSTGARGVTNNTTASGNAVLHFAATSAFSSLVANNLAVGWTVQDYTTPGVIPAGTTILSSDATTITMSANATGAGVASGDLILLNNTYIVKNIGQATQNVKISNMDPIFWPVDPSSTPMINFHATYGNDFPYTLAMPSPILPPYSRHYTIEHQGSALDAKLLTAPRSPQVILGTVLAVEQDPTTWDSLTGSTVGVGNVASILAPDGSTNAGLVKGAAGTIVNLHAAAATRTLALNDWMIVGCWLHAGTSAEGGTSYSRPVTPTLTAGGTTVFNGGILGSTVLGFQHMPNRIGDNDWVWNCEAFKVTTASGGAVAIHLQLPGTTQNQLTSGWTAFFMPGIIHLPATLGMSDAAVRAYSRSLTAWPSSSVAGTTGTVTGDVPLLPGQKLRLGGPFSVAGLPTGARIASLAAVPAGGAWQVGDVVLNTAPAAGSPPGWQCVAAGTPGTWVTLTPNPVSPTTQTGSTYSVGANDYGIIGNNSSGTLTLTLPSAASFPGRELLIKTTQANTVVSASSNVVAITGGAAGTAILAATSGKWALLQSDASNWIIMASN